MEVTLIAHTALAHTDAEEPATLEWLDCQDGDTDADFLAEFAGRACYQSWHRPNPKTATNAGYMAHILEVDHQSVLSHASATFYVTGISRALTHELVRSVFLSYSQLSQRYVDESGARFVVPPAFQEDSDTTRDLHDFHAHARWLYGDLVDRAVSRGYTRKEARGAARAVLANMTETKIVVSGNLRAWRDFIAQRNTVHADAEIRLFAAEVLRQLRGIAPNSFQDLKDGA